MTSDIIINDRIAIPAAELTLTASRSSGPGGQHVNTADTRVQLRWNLTTSAAFSQTQKIRLQNALRSRLTLAGELIMASDAHRSQRRNREEVCQRLAALLRQHLTPPKPRRPTRPTRASRQRRLDDKKRRAQVKKRRGDTNDDY